MKTGLGSDSSELKSADYPLEKDILSFLDHGSSTRAQNSQNTNRHSGDSLSDGTENISIGITKLPMRLRKTDENGTEIKIPTEIKTQASEATKVVVGRNKAKDLDPAATGYGRGSYGGIHSRAYGNDGQ